MTLVFPGDPEFDLILGVIPPPDVNQIEYKNNQVFYVARADTGILEAVDYKEFEDYANGGEYDERLTQIGDDESDGQSDDY